MTAEPPRIEDAAIGCPMCQPGKVHVARRPGCPVPKQGAK